MYNKNEAQELSSEKKPLIKQMNAASYPIEGRYRFFHVPAFLDGTNNSALCTDALIGATASASNKFDIYIQKKESLAFLIPVYLVAFLVLPLIVHLFKNKTWWCSKTKLAAIDLRAEDEFLLRNAKQEHQIISLDIKSERLNRKNNAQYLTQIPTLLLNISIHLAYLSLLIKDTPDNFLVENFDWLSPTLIFSMLIILNFLTTKFYRENGETYFQRKITHFDSEENDLQCGVRPAI